MPKAKKILIVVLDWGLGHATRCVPIIAHLLSQGFEVFIGGNEKTNALLQKEFPNLEFIYFRGYEMSYAEKGENFIWKMIAQVPKMWQRVRAERKQCAKIQKKYQFDYLISDNRFGVYIQGIKNFFITHQIHVHLPQSKILQGISNRINHFYMKKYNAIFVPDMEGSVLSGGLSSVKKYKQKGKVYFLGLLSRFIAKESEKKNEILVVLSGPEPQRTLLENKILQGAKTIQETIFVVQARPGNEDYKKEGNVTMVSHLSANDLNNKMLEADIIISRTGYTTVMDLVKIKRQAILIPTPGQTEQEYLGKWYKESALFQIENQESFDLKNAIDKYRINKLHPLPEYDFDEYKNVLNKFIV